MRKNESQLPRGLLCCDSMPKEPLTCWVRTNYRQLQNWDRRSLKASTLCANQN